MEMVGWDIQLVQQCLCMNRHFDLTGNRLANFTQNFKLLLDQYPENAKVPDALYKLGKVHFLKGNRERSREYLDQVIRQYSGHPAAQLSRDFLDENF